MDKDVYINISNKNGSIIFASDRSQTEEALQTQIVRNLFMFMLLDCV